MYRPTTYVVGTVGTVVPWLRHETTRKKNYRGGGREKKGGRSFPPAVGPWWATRDEAPAMASRGNLARAS